MAMGHSDRHEISDVINKTIVKSSDRWSYHRQDDILSFANRRAKAAKMTICEFTIRRYRPLVESSLNVDQFTLFCNARNRVNISSYFILNILKTSATHLI